MGSASFGETSLHCNGLCDIYIVKLDADGNWIWAQRAGGVDIEMDSGYGITIDSNGNSYITGCFEGTTTFGTASLNSSGFSDIFIAKLSTDYVLIDDELTPENNSFSRLFSAYPNPLLKGNNCTIKADI